MNMPVLRPVRALNILKATMLVALISTMAPTAGYCDVINGDFSAGAMGFTFTGNVGIFTSSNYVACCASGDTGTGNFAAFGGGDGPDGGKVSQSFVTTPGKEYSLSFQYGAFSSPAGVGTQSLAISAGNLDTTLISATSARDLSEVLSTYSYDFVATNDVTTLSFTDVSTNTSSIDGFLDTIDVASVPTSVTPEPSSLMLLGTGIAGLSAFCRNRIRK